MAVTIPRLPRGEPKFTYNANFLDLTPGEGGPTQRVNKLGDRFRYEHSFVLNGCQGMGLIALLNSTRGEVVRLPVTQVIAVGSPGASVQVNGANAGRSLVVKGVTGGYAFQAGQYISITKSGRSYLHQVVSDVTASGGGAATLTIVPMLRVPLTGNEAVEVANPVIEGFLTQRQNTYVTNTYVNSVKIDVSIEEAE